MDDVKREVHLQIRNIITLGPRRVSKTGPKYFIAIPPEIGKKLHKKMVNIYIEVLGD